MAKRHLEQYDKNGNKLDIYINDDEVMVGDQTLAEKLADMEDDIGDAAQTGGEGTVTGVKVGDTTYEPTEGVVDLSTPFGGKVDKNGTDSLMSAEEHTKLEGIETGAEKNIIKGVKANGASTNLPVDQNGVVELPPAGSTISPATAAPSMDGNTAAVGVSDKYAREDHVHPHDSSKLSKSDVSVETQGDGTVDINVKDDTYTINLNHTHENMAKLVVCEESDLPSTYDPATIYAITDSGETEIEKLIIRGMEFAGGGIPDTGEPMISSPSNGSTINLGDNTSGQGVSKTITIKGKNLTGDLTVAVGTGLTISYGQVMDGSSVTIPMAQALLGAQVTIAYSGTGALDDGSLVIRQGNDVLSSVVVVVVVENWVEVDLTQNQVDAWIGSNGNWSYSSGSTLQTCCLIDATAIEKIRITSNPTNSSFFLFLKTVPSFPTNAAYASYLCSGETGRRTQVKDTTETYEIPSDCVKVMIGLQANGNVAPMAYAPTKVEVQ